MIQRSIFRSARTLSSISRTPAQAPTQFAQCRFPSPRPQRIQVLVAPARSRWYSATPESSGGAKTNAVEGVREGGKDAAPSSEGQPPAGTAPEVQDATKRELEAKTNEVIELKDKYLRSVADYRNLQERTRREVQSAKDFALQRFATDLLSSLDNLELALSTVTPEKLDPAQNKTPHEDLVSLHSGLRMTERVLLQTLRRHGLERFDPAEQGAPFDPNRHEAMFQAPQQGKEEGSVFHTQQKGFLLNGRVLRAAKVGVVRNS